MVKYNHQVQLTFFSHLCNDKSWVKRLTSDYKPRWWPIWSVLNSSFHSMKRLGVSTTPLDDLDGMLVNPQHFVRLP